MLLSNPYHPDDRVRNEALALIESGYSVRILAWDRLGQCPVHETISGVEIKRATAPTGYGLGLKKILRYLRVWQWYVKEIDSAKPDVVHCHDYDTYLAGVWYAAFHKNIKLVLDTHENYYMMIKPLASPPLALAIGLLERLLTRLSHLLISSNQATADHYSRFGARKVVVVGNWKNPENYDFEAELIARTRRDLGICNNQLVIAYIGALSADRNVLSLLQAIETRPHVFLILGGRGDQENEIRKVCVNMRNVYFPGYIHPDTVPLLTVAADLIYYGYDPGHVYAPYNAPNKLYEALAAGKPILASDLGGELSDVVKNVRCGVLLSHVDPDSIGAAIDFLAPASVRSAMQARSRAAGQNIYNWTIAQNKLRLAYSALFV